VPALDDDSHASCPPARIGLDHPSMRFIIHGLLLASACATAHPRAVANIPATRHQIDETIASDPGIARRTADFQYQTASGAPAGDPAQLPPSRKITAMGRVTPDRAVVFTRSGRPGATTLEETWVREADGWKLAHVTELGRTTDTSASR
jgi:hypothetical protein